MRPWWRKILTPSASSLAAKGVSASRFASNSRLLAASFGPCDTSKTECRNTSFEIGKCVKDRDSCRLQPVGKVQRAWNCVKTCPAFQQLCSRLQCHGESHLVSWQDLHGPTTFAQWRFAFCSPSDPAKQPVKEGDRLVSYTRTPIHTCSTIQAIKHVEDSKDQCNVYIKRYIYHKAMGQKLAIETSEHVCTRMRASVHLLPTLTILPFRLEAAKASVIRAHSPELWLWPLLALAPPGSNG